MRRMLVEVLKDLERYPGFQAEEDIHDNLRRGQELVRNSSQRWVCEQRQPANKPSRSLQKTERHDLFTHSHYITVQRQDMIQICR